MFKDKLSEQTKNIIFRNPCRYCISRPACNRTCKKLTYHGDTLFLIICLFLQLVISGTVFSIFNFIIHVGIICSIASTYIIAAMIVAHFLFYIGDIEYNGTASYYWNYFILLCIFSFSLHLTYWLSIEGNINIYIRRVNKKLL